MLESAKYSKFLPYLMICISLIFSGCQVAYNAPVSSRLDVQPNRKQILVSDAADLPHLKGHILRFLL
jgi:hypothetical protein